MNTKIIMNSAINSTERLTSNYLTSRSTGKAISFVWSWYRLKNTGLTHGLRTFNFKVMHASPATSLRWWWTRLPGIYDKLCNLKWKCIYQYFLWVLYTISCWKPKFWENTRFTSTSPVGIKMQAICTSIPRTKVLMIRVQTRT